MDEHEKLYVTVAEKLHKQKEQLLRLGEIKPGTLAADFMRMDYKSMKKKYKMSELEIDQLSYFFENGCKLSGQLDSIDMQFNEFKKAQRNLDFRRRHENIDYSFMNAID